MRTSHLVGRTIGLLVFLAGILMLGYVFVLGWRIFENPGFAGAQTAASAQAGGADRILSHLVVVLVRLAFLLAMCVAGSLIASKGILLYGSLVHHAPSADAASGPAPSRQKRAAENASD